MRRTWDVTRTGLPQRRQGVDHLAVALDPAQPRYGEQDLPPPKAQLLTRPLPGGLVGSEDRGVDAGVHHRHLLRRDAEIEDAPEDDGAPPIASRRPWLVAAAFALLAIVAIAVALRPRPTAPDAHLRFSITFPEEAPLTLWGSANQTTSSLAISD